MFLLIDKASSKSEPFKDDVGLCCEDLKRQMIEFRSNEFQFPILAVERCSNKLTRWYQHLMELYGVTKMDIVLLDKVYVSIGFIYCKKGLQDYPQAEMVFDHNDGEVMCTLKKRPELNQSLNMQETQTVL